MERVVLNALAKTRGFAAGYLRLRRIKAHRLEDKPIYLHSQRIEIRGEIAVELMTRAKYDRSLRRNQHGNHRPGTNR